MKQVLLVDASPLFREYLKEKLIAEQVAVEMAIGNKDAYTKLVNILPDLIVIDVDENFASLQDFLTSKQNDPNAYNIPIIIAGPSIPKAMVAKLTQYAVVKYFTKPIKFDAFFDSISKMLHSTFTMDDTPSLLEVHINGNIIFVEAAQGLNRDKISLLKYKLQELIDENHVREPKLVIMMTNLDLTFVDGTNLEQLLDTVTADGRIFKKNIKILSFDTFAQELIAGHEKYKDIEVVHDLTDVLNSLVSSGAAANINELVTDRILTPEDSPSDGDVEMRFKADSNEGDDTDGQGDGTLRIAIVDDDPVVHKLLANAFSRIGAQTAPYMAGTAFLKALEKEIFDLIILDIFLPDINGLEILHSLQQQNMETPIIIYSQATRRDSVVQALSMGAKSYLVKPQKPDAVVQKVQEVLNIQ